VEGDTPYEIPYYKIKNASLSINDEIGFSRIRVRGRYKEFEDDVLTITIGPSYYNMVTDTTPQSINFPIPTFYDLTALKIVNARVECSHPLFVSGYLANPRLDGLVWFVDLNLEVTGTLSDPGGHTLSGVDLIFGDVQEAIGTSIQNSPVKGSLRQSAKVSRALQRTRGQTYSKYGVSFRSLKPPDEKEDNRLDVVVEDVDLFNSFGVLWEEIDNVYIPNETRCYEVAERRFQEYKQSRKKWQIDMVYDKDVEINQRVAVKVPDTNKLIQGVVRQIELTFDAKKSSLMMKLDIEEFRVDLV
jgi:hypothetical protein